MACTTCRNGDAVQVSLLSALLLAVLYSSAASVDASDPICGPFENSVYPYWSNCFNPATYQEQFQLLYTPARSGGDGWLAPEWDESNSTYYMRLADSAATYRLRYITREGRPFVSQADNVIFTNVDTSRNLAWRQEGDEYFLVEADLLHNDFQFLLAPNVPLACPRSLTARCEAYSLVSHSTSEGLSTYEEDGAVYFKKASSDLAPFVLMRVSESTRTDTSSSVHLANSAA